ncbi:hypothetical protein OSB04_009873 [Centaurea solstitialis]|uniref:S-protein homolog n=1 Tax=Centaurea solstitialis TaxID=347529 RepID=A0AA38WMJ8_9ASTR|nr:hypothetical protein OSB04_009873 [Centaurea solstitialis]
MPNIFIVLFLFFIPTFSLDYPLNCFLEPQWHMFVTCDLPQQLQFSITDTNTEKDVTLSFGQTYDWYFCPDGKYIGDFKWGSKHQNVELFRSDDYDNVCHRFKFGTIHCYWLVTPDGFYVSKHNVPYPNSDWHFDIIFFSIVETQNDIWDQDQETNELVLQSTDPAFTKITSHS